MDGLEDLLAKVPGDFDTAFYRLPHKNVWGSDIFDGKEGLWYGEGETPSLALTAALEKMGHKATEQ